MKKNKIPLNQQRINYSLFFGILILLSFIINYFLYYFSKILSSKIYFGLATIFLVFSLFWFYREKRYNSTKTQNKT